MTRIARQIPLSFLVSLVFVLAGWEVATEQGWLRADFVSRPTEIARALLLLLGGSPQFDLYKHLRVSAIQWGTGYLLALAAGLMLGMVMGRVRTVKVMLEPFVMGLYSTPMVVLLPLFIIWLGTGSLSKVTAIFCAAFVPIVVSVTSGAEQVQASLVDMARSFRLPVTQTFLHVVCPACLPQFLVGARIALVRGLIMMVIADFYASSEGLGYLLVDAGYAVRADVMFALVAIFVAFSLGMNGLLGWAEAKIAHWR